MDRNERERFRVRAGLLLRSQSLRWTIFALLVHLPGPEDVRAEKWTVRAEAWPEADVLFHRDSRWVGADGANSIDLGSGRVLWTFGDTFVDTNADASQRRRRTATFIRNSIAIQMGYDPTRAEFVPFWQESKPGGPSAFFPSAGDVLYWPGGGLLVEEQLLIFLMRIRNAKQGLGFAVAGWGAVLIGNPGDNPRKWRMNFISAPQNAYGVIVGSGSSLRMGNWVYAFSAEKSSHDLFLVRFSVPAILAGDLSEPHWWMGPEGRWVAQDALGTRLPKPLIPRGQTEFTVHFESRLQRYVLTQFAGFPRTPLAIRLAEKLTGPWSELQAAFHPEELQRAPADLMLYAAKAHPEQAADGLAVTYCSNTTDLARVVNDETVYYPRFARITVSRDPH